MIEIDKKSTGELRFLTPPKVEVASKQKYCRFKKMGIKYIDYKDPEFLMRFLNEQGKLSALYHIEKFGRYFRGL